MRYTITIKDNKINEILFDEQANCIIGAWTENNVTTTVSLIDAKSSETVDCARGASNAIKHVLIVLSGDNKEGTNA